MTQLDLFSAGTPAPAPINFEGLNPAPDRELTPRELWKESWDWDGPEVGKPCDIRSKSVMTEQGEEVFVQDDRCIILESRPDGDGYLAEIAVGEVDGEAWDMDGVRVVLYEEDIWPPVQDLLAERLEQCLQ